MYHSIFIERTTTSGSTNTWNTWTDWHLIPTSRPFVNQPSINEKYVDIPGRDGPIDLTTVLTGSATPTFGNRKGSWEFYIMHDLWSDWSTAYQTIANHLKGKVFQVRLEDDATYYYQGRLHVSSYKPQKDYSTITIDYTLDPYKISTTNPDDKKL